MALDGIDLAVAAGRVTGLVGPNDAGKSTLCLVAAGLAPAVIGGHLEGRVTISGHDTAGSRPHEIAQRCGSLFQNPATQLSGTTATVWEEVAVGPRNLALPLDDVVERVDTALETLGTACGGEIRGVLITIDNFGNLITNIDGSLVTALARPVVLAGGHAVPFTERQDLKF